MIGLLQSGTGMGSGMWRPIVSSTLPETSVPALGWARVTAAVRGLGAPAEVLFTLVELTRVSLGVRLARWRRCERVAVWCCTLALGETVALAPGGCWAVLVLVDEAAAEAVGADAALGSSGMLAVGAAGVLGVAGVLGDVGVLPLGGAVGVSLTGGGLELVVVGGETLTLGSETSTPGSDTLTPGSEVLTAGRDTVMPGSDTVMGEAPCGESSGRPAARALWFPAASGATAKPASDAPTPMAITVNRRVLIGQ